ncbi:MAG: family transporter protein, partial [Nocardioides sp.]|nr:family transporter protein [Nocardioides sp.]
VLLLLAAAVVVPVVIFGATAWNTREPSAAERARMEQLLEKESNRNQVQRQLRDCLEQPSNFGIPAGDDVQAACEAQVLPQPEWFGFRQPLDLVNEREQGSGTGVVVVLVLLMLLTGTTFVGHDWNSGSMSNQLLFEPRRLRVWAAKGLVVLVSGFAVAMTVLAAYWLGLAGLAAWRGLTVPDHALADGLEQGLRGALVAGFAGLAGYALTMLFRSTVATLGVMFAVAVAGGMLLAVLGIQNSEQWQPQNNAAAVVMDGYSYYDDSALPESCFTGKPVEGTDCSGQRTLGAGAGGRYLGALLVLVGVPSVLSFRRRDVP